MDGDGFGFLQSCRVVGNMSLDHRSNAPRTALLDTDQIKFDGFHCFPVISISPRGESAHQISPTRKTYDEQNSQIDFEALKQARHETN